MGRRFFAGPFLLKLSYRSVVPPLVMVIIDATKCSW
jgi:hypothetical protein